MTLKKYVIEGAIQKVVEGAKSVSSRSVIRDKIVSYRQGETDFEELQRFTYPKYMEGIKALDSCVYAARYVSGKLLVEYKGADFKNPATPVDSGAVKAYLLMQGPAFIFGAQTPVKQKDDMLATDVIFCRPAELFKKIENAGLKIDILNDNSRSSLLRKDTVFLKDGRLIFVTPSELTNALYKFSVPDTNFRHELNTFRKRHLITAGLFTLLVILLILLIYQSSKLHFFKQGKYLQELVDQKTADLNRVISQLEKTNQSLRESEKQLKETNHTKDKFFSVIAHDLKNPFNAIMGFSEILISKGDRLSSEKSAEYYSHIYEVAKNAEELLENLLTWGKTQERAIVIHQKRINLFQIGQEMVIRHESSARLKDIDLVNNIPRGIHVFADGNMMHTILRNLITNAVKYTREHGTVTISAAVKDNMVEVIVTDTGVGMDERTLNSVFKKEELKSRPGTRNEKGTGLGLMICKEFIEQHNGRIWAESKPEQGSRFIFTVPVAQV